MDLTCKHFDHVLVVNLGNQRGVREVTLALGGFFRQDMAFVSMSPFDFSTSGEGETFLGTGF
jgi:hypothetical protein